MRTMKLAGLILIVLSFIALARNTMMAYTGSVNLGGIPLHGPLFPGGMALFSLIGLALAIKVFNHRCPQAGPEEPRVRLVGIPEPIREKIHKMGGNPSSGNFRWVDLGNGRYVLTRRRLPKRIDDPKPKNAQTKP